MPNSVEIGERRQVNSAIGSLRRGQSDRPWNDCTKRRIVVVNGEGDGVQSNKVSTVISSGSPCAVIYVPWPAYSLV